jgi:hypothetical protein
VKSAGRASGGLVGCGCCLGFVSGLVVYVFFGFGEVGFFWQQIVAGLLFFFSALLSTSLVFDWVGHLASWFIASSGDIW